MTMATDIQQDHDQAVARIAATVRKFYDQKEKFRIYHGSTSSTRQSQTRRENMIDTTSMSRILKIDTERKVALVEPNVTMDCLVEATLKYDLIPPVVMEFPGITVGGGFSRTSGESSSFRYGSFDRTINWIEIVLANGETTTASQKERPDLFHGAASSFGTLGIITLLEIQLIDAKSHVVLTYFPVSSIAEAIEMIEFATQITSTDCLDGIMYSRHNGVVCAGELTNSSFKNCRTTGFSKPTDPWFYLHAQKLLKNTRGAVTERVPIVDYLFRYDRGGFWCARYAFKYFLTPFNRFTRRALDKFMHARVMYHALHKSGFASHYVLQDVAVPYENADELLQYLDNNFGHYPIWLCPLKIDGKSTDTVRNKMAIKTNRPSPEYMINFGVWGPGPKDRRRFVEWNRVLERKVHELGGQKCLYAHAYYTKEEFDEIYDGKTYDAVREKYHATYLPSVYDKVKVDVEAEEIALRESLWLRIVAMFWMIWPLSGLYGVCAAALGGDYLLPMNTHATLI